MRENVKWDTKVSTHKRKGDTLKTNLRQKIEGERMLLYSKEWEADAPGLMILSGAMMQSEAIHHQGEKEKCPRETLQVFCYGEKNQHYTEKKGEETSAFRRRRNTLIRSDVMWRNMSYKR